MGPVAVIFIQRNGKRVAGELGLEGRAGVRQLMFRTRRADAFDPDALREGSVLIYSDPGGPPTETVRVLMEVAERQGVKVIRSLFP